MPQGDPEYRTIIDMTIDGGIGASYTLAPHQYLRAEMIVFRAGGEGPLFWRGTVTYQDPMLGELAFIESGPNLCSNAASSGVVTFSFYLDGGWNPTYIPEVQTIPIPVDSHLQSMFGAPLPDTVLQPSQIVSVRVEALTPAGDDGGPSMEFARIVGVDLTDTTVPDVVPPYTPESYLSQSAAA